MLAGIAIYLGVSLARSTLPQISGTVTISGLHGPVTIVRDRWGVPYIFAGDDHDLLVAQGYVTAQDRLWQMLLRRQAARGRLSDWLGAKATQADQVLSYAYPATAHLPRLDAKIGDALEAFAVGVNVCIQTCPAPLELELLRRQGKLDRIERWSPEDSLALARMALWAQERQVGADWPAALSARIGVTRTAQLWPEGAALTGPGWPADPAVRQALQWSGIGLWSAEFQVAASTPGLPAPWYLVSLHSERTLLAGGTWPGWPGVVITQTAPLPDPYLSREERDLLEHLLALPPQNWLQTRVHGMLRQWDLDTSGKTRLGNASTAVYQVWVWHLARDTFQDELGPDVFTRYWATGRALQALAGLIEKPDEVWWDDVTTPPRETRDDVLRRAYAEALDDIGRHYGDLHTIWEWDTMHTAQLRHPLGGAWLLSLWLNRAIKLGGNAPFDPSSSNDSYQAYAPMLIPSLQIERNGFALAGGQSGHPFSPHYADLLEMWARGQTVPLQDIARPQDVKDVEGMLVLVPNEENKP